MKQWGMIAAVLVFAGTAPAMAVTTCDLPNPSCSRLAAVCKSFNKKAGSDTSRCDGYKAACMQTGSWQDRNCSRSNVAKK